MKKRVLAFVLAIVVVLAGIVIPTTTTQAGSKNPTVTLSTQAPVVGVSMTVTVKPAYWVVGTDYMLVKLYKWNSKDNDYTTLVSTSDKVYYSDISQKGTFELTISAAGKYQIVGQTYCGSNSLSGSTAKEVEVQALSDFSFIYPYENDSSAKLLLGTSISIGFNINNNLMTDHTCKVYVKVKKGSTTLVSKSYDANELGKWKGESFEYTPKSTGTYTVYYYEKVDGKSAKTYKYTYKFYKKTSIVDMKPGLYFNADYEAKTLNVIADGIYGIDGIIVYRSTSATGTFTKKTSGSDKYVTYSKYDGTRYYYKLRAYVKYGGKTYYSEYSDVIRMPAALSKPVISSIENTSEGIKLTWKKDSKAKYVDIQRYDAETGKWTWIAQVEGSVTSYTDTNAQYAYDTGDTVKYRIYTNRTVGDYCYMSSAYSAVKSIRLNELLASKPNIYIDIDKATKTTLIGVSIYADADGYDVYRSTTKSGEYTRVGRYSSKKINLTYDGTRYYYKLRAYVKVGGNTYYSQYSDAIRMLAIGTPTLKSVALREDNDAYVDITWSWGSTSGTPTRFEIYFKAVDLDGEVITSTSMSEYPGYEYIGYVGADDTSYAHFLKYKYRYKGYKLYYMVRAVKEQAINEYYTNSICGAMSKVKSVTYTY